MPPPPSKKPRYPLNRRVGGPPKQSGQFGKDKNLLLLPKIEFRIVELVDESLYYGVTEWQQYELATLCSVEPIPWYQRQRFRHSGKARFETPPGVIILRVFVAFLSPSLKIPGQYLKARTTSFSIPSLSLFTTIRSFDAIQSVLQTASLNTPRINQLMV